MNVTEGVTRFVSGTTASTGAANTYVDVRPSAGCAWEVLSLWGWQDDGAVNQSWNWTDIDVTNQILTTITGAANTHWWFITKDDTPDAVQLCVAPPILTYDRYLRFCWSASAAGKNGYFRALVREYRGIPLEA